MKASEDADFQGAGIIVPVTTEMTGVTTLITTMTAMVKLFVVSPFNRPRVDLLGASPLVARTIGCTSTAAPR